MTNNIEHLKLIRARCVKLLEIAEKRTPGEWADEYGITKMYIVQVLPDKEFGKLVAECDHSDAAFIAACAGPAEAGWRATIRMIDRILIMLEFYTIRPTEVTRLTELELVEDFANYIIKAWPLELLQGGSK